MTLTFSQTKKIKKSPIKQQYVVPANSRVMEFSYYTMASRKNLNYSDFTPEKLNTKFVFPPDESASIVLFIGKAMSTLKLTRGWESSRSNMVEKSCMVNWKNDICELEIMTDGSITLSADEGVYNFFNLKHGVY